MSQRVLLGGLHAVMFTHMEVRKEVHVTMCWILTCHREIVDHYVRELDLAHIAAT